jgi:hypothetical protein
MRTLCMIALTIAFMAGPALAEGRTADIDKHTCKQLMAGNDDSRGSTLAFFQGYRTGKAGANTIDLDALSDLSDKVRDYCLDNPTSTVLAAFEAAAK